MNVQENGKIIYLLAKNAKMISYIVTLLNIPQSVKSAQRCIDSAMSFNVTPPVIFPAVYKDIALTEAKNEHLGIGKFDTSFSNINAVVGNFVTQYRIWKTILESNEPGIVLEHDAVFVGNIPDLKNHNIVNLGKPSYGNFNKKDKPGIYPMFSKTGGYIPGAHGYYLTPRGAEELITKAKKLGATPCDLFLNKTNFPNIMEIYPWVIEAKDEFTTIQKEKGCTAKHNYSKDFEIIT